MDLSLSEEQEMLRKSAREFLDRECPKKLVREMEQDEKGYSPELWKKMAELGWMGLVFPEEYGGTGSFLSLIILLEEMGRALLPGPFVSTVVCSGLPILHYGTEEQKRNLLLPIVQGELIMTLAVTEPETQFGEVLSQAKEPETKAVRDGNNYTISGIKLFVPDAHVANWLLCLARTGKGVSLFLIDSKSQGIKCDLLKTMASDKQCEVTLDNVRVPATNIMGGIGKGWEIVERIGQWAALANCALILGGLEQVLEATVSYAKQRVQFERLIGSFQAIQHKCADMLIDVDGARFLTYEAAWKLSQNLPAGKESSMAKAWTSDASRKVCLEAIRVHGGVGISVDHDMQLYFRRAKAMEITWGNGDFHREIVARSIGL